MGEFKGRPIRNDLMLQVADFILRSTVIHLTAVMSADPSAAQDTIRCNFDIEVGHDGYGCLAICPRNIFSLMAIMGIYRDPAMLQAMTKRVAGSEPGSWRDVFRDERGTWTVSYNPTYGWDSSFAPEILAEYLSTPVDLRLLPEDPE